MPLGRPTPASPWSSLRRRAPALGATSVGDDALLRVLVSLAKDATPPSSRPVGVSMGKSMWSIKGYKVMPYAAYIGPHTLTRA